MSLRVGIVGWGEIAQYHARHLTAAGARIVGAVTRRPTDIGITAYPSLSAMLPEVDAVTIAVPNALHAKLCMEAVTAETAVFVEKPLCIDGMELQALQTALRTTAAPVHVGFRLRWNPGLRVLQSRLRGIRRIRCVYRLGIERLAAGKPWTRHEAESGGAYCTLGVHALDLARWLAGAGARPLADMRATAAHLDKSADFPLAVRLQGRIPDGAEIDVGADLRGDRAFRLELEVDAEHGSFPDSSFLGILPEDPGAYDAEYARMMTHFVDAAISRQTSAHEIAEILQCHREILTGRSLASRA